MSRLATTLLALLLLGAGLPLSAPAVEEPAAAVQPPAEATDPPAPLLSEQPEPSAAETPELPGEGTTAEPEASLSEQPDEPAPATGEGGAETGGETEPPPEPKQESLPERLEEGLGEALGEIQEEVGQALEKPLSLADSAHGKISEGVVATGRWLDSFFADPRVESEAAKTRVRLRFSLLAEENSTTEYDVQANVRLDLPVLEGKLHLLLAGDPEEDDDFQAITGREGVPPQLANADDRVSASLRYFLVRTLYQNISLRAGVRLRNGTPALFLEPRYRHLLALGPWLFRFTQRFIGFTEGTVGARTTLDLERELRPPLFFRTTADGSWFSDEDGYAYSLGFFLYQPLSPRSVMVYSWANSFLTHPSDRLEEVILSARFRQQIWREWFYYELAPQVSFPHERDYRATAGFLVRLEMLFGDLPALSPKKEEAATEETPSAASGNQQEGEQP